MKKLITLLTWPIKKLLLGLIIGIRPLLGPSNCKYQQSCTLYGIQQLNEEPLLKATWNIIKRVCACANPFHKHDRC